jgi:hypothetical protein
MPLNSPVRAAPPLWPLVVGAVVMGLTVLFLMGLILLSTAGHQVPCGSRFLVAAVLALTVGIGGSFLGGSAAVRGQIPWRGAKEHPIRFAVTGGIAAFVVTLLLGAKLYDGGPDCIDQPSAAHAKVRGRVIGSDGAPVGAARVSLAGVDARTTGSDGLFEVPVDGHSLTEPFSISVYAAGYVPATKNFELRGNDVELGDLRLVQAK